MTRSVKSTLIVKTPNPNSSFNQSEHMGKSNKILGKKKKRKEQSSNPNPNPSSRRIKSITSAARYSRTAERYTGAPAPTLSANLPAFKNLAILPTGNWRPALLDRETDFELLGLPLPPLVDAAELIFDRSRDW